jgi:hypothetical protein
MCVYGKRYRQRFIATITFIYASRHTKHTYNVNVMKFMDGEGAIYLKRAYILRLWKMQVQHYVLKQMRKHYILTVLIGYTNTNCIYVRHAYR